MFKKTNIPKTTLCLAGDLVSNGDILFDRLSVNDRHNEIQVSEPLGEGGKDFLLGNRCNHMPDEPRFFNPPDHHKRRPPILENAIYKWEKVYWKAKRFFMKLAAFHSHGRQVRSERREAIASVSQVMLHYLELSTLRVGFYVESNKFIHLDIHYLAKKAGLSFSRAKRAINALAKAGYIKVTRQYKKKENGTFDCEPSIREIAVQFFIDLGMDVQSLFFAREWKRKKEEKEQAKKGLKKIKDVVQAATSFARKFVSYKKSDPNSVRLKQELIGQALSLHQSDPSRSPSDYLKELQKLKE